MEMFETNFRDQASLVRACQEGDLSAFDFLVRRFRHGAVLLASQILARRDLAEDAVQDAFLDAYKALPQLRNVDQFPAWFGSIVRNRAKRTLADRNEKHFPLDKLILAYVPSIVAGVEQGESNSVIRCAVRDLSKDIREIVELYYFEEWPVRTIAGFLGLPETTVKWRLNVGRKQLRLLLEPMEDNF